MRERFAVTPCILSCESDVGTRSMSGPFSGPPSLSQERISWAHTHGCQLPSIQSIIRMKCSTRKSYLDNNFLHYVSRYQTRGGAMVYWIKLVTLDQRVAVRFPSTPGTFVYTVRHFTHIDDLHPGV